jgi:hypothetical protein
MLHAVRKGGVVLLLTVICLMAAPISAGASVTLRDIRSTPHRAPEGASLEDISTAIKLAASGEGWEIVSETAGSIEARLTNGDKMALVVIRFDDSNYWIKYVDSANLGYSPDDVILYMPERNVTIKGPVIHRSFNTLILNLSTEIKKRTRWMRGRNS